MKYSLVTSCAFAALLLLTGCSTGSNEAGGPAQSGSASATSDAPSGTPTTAPPTPAATPTPTSTPTPAAVEAPSEDELEARVTALTDVLGDPLQLVSAEQAAAALDIAQAVMEGADVQPVECKDYATGNAAASGDLAAEAVSGVGAADESGGYLAVVLLDGSTEEAIQQGFDLSRVALEKCAEVTATIEGNTITSVSEELPLNQIGEESFALRMTQKIGAEQVFETLSITARGDGVIANVQAMSQSGLDGITQDQLADLAAQLLKPSEE